MYEGAIELAPIYNYADIYRLEYHNFLLTEPNALNGFDHFHVFEENYSSAGIVYEKIEGEPIGHAHSMFWPMYLKGTNGGATTVFPNN